MAKRSRNASTVNALATRCRWPKRSRSHGRSPMALDAAHEKGHRPPRSEAGERDDHAGRCSEGAGLRDRQSSRRRRVIRRDEATLEAGPTQHGTVLGTAPYMSPEQARGFGVDKRSDIWAFGCVLYELLTGKRAFNGETGSDVIARHPRAHAGFRRVAGGDASPSNGCCGAASSGIRNDACAT